MPKIPCPSHQVYSKKYKKCVNIGSDEYFKILEENPASFDVYEKKIMKFMQPKPTEQPGLKCPKPKKVYNKNTKRCVEIGSQTYYKALKKDPSVFDDQKDKISLILIKKDKKINKKLLEPVVKKANKNSKAGKKLLNAIFGSPNKVVFNEQPIKPKTVTKNTQTLKPKMDTKKAKMVLKNLLMKKMLIAPPAVKPTYTKYSDTSYNSIINLKFASLQTYSDIFLFNPKNFSIGSTNLKYDYGKNTNTMLQLFRTLNIDLDSAYNFDHKWYSECYNYIIGLDIGQLWSLRAYSHKGDVYMNLTERGIPLNYNNIDNLTIFYEYLKMVVKNRNGYSVHDDVFGKVDENFIKSNKTNIIRLIKEPRTLTVSTITKILTDFNEVKFKKHHYDFLIKNLIKTLDGVLAKAPALGKKLTVFRGVKDAFFTKSAFNKNFKNEIFLNKGYVSTSLSWDVALGTFAGKGCCFNVVTLLPGTRCLPLIGTSKYSNEYEILLRKDLKFLLRRKFKGNIRGKLMKVSHVIAT